VCVAVVFVVAFACSFNLLLLLLLFLLFSFCSVLSFQFCLSQPQIKNNEWKKEWKKKIIIIWT